MAYWKRDISKALTREVPILLDLRFDPGWDDLRGEFEGKASVFKPTRQAEKLLNAEHSLVPFKNTAEFLKIADHIIKTDHKALSRTYIMFENDVRSYDEFVIGGNKKKLINLQNSFHMATTAISKLSKAERDDFLIGIEEDKDKRAKAFPVLTFLRPSDKTRERALSDDSLRHDKGTFQRISTNKEGVFVTLQSLDPTGITPYARRIIQNSNKLAVIAVPYVHRDEFQDALDMHTEFKDENTQFGLMIMKLSRGSYQLGTNIPSSLDAS